MGTVRRGIKEVPGMYPQSSGLGLVTDRARDPRCYFLLCSTHRVGSSHLSGATNWHRSLCGAQRQKVTVPAQYGLPRWCCARSLARTRACWLSARASFLFLVCPAATMCACADTAQVPLEPTITINADVFPLRVPDDIRIGMQKMAN